ncbi:MAG: hypothetical protein AABX28_00100 [Nanoarchaeota archaeon]
MARKKFNLLNLVAWLTGIVVSLVVGTAMTDGTLSLPGWLGGNNPVGLLVTMVVGWVVVITTLVSAALAVLQR